MDFHKPFWFTTVVTGTTDIGTGVTLATGLAQGEPPAVPFEMVIQIPVEQVGRPTNLNATVVKVTALDSLTGIATIERDLDGATSFPIVAGYQCYQSLDGLLKQMDNMSWTCYSQISAQACINSLNTAGLKGTIIIQHPLRTGAVTITKTTAQLYGIEIKRGIKGITIADGTYCQPTANSDSYNLFDYPGCSFSPGTAFSGTINEDKVLLTTASGGVVANGITTGDIIAIIHTPTGIIWQFMNVRNIPTTDNIYTIQATAWPYTTDWKVHKISNYLEDFEFSGEIRNNSNTGSATTALHIYGSIYAKVNVKCSDFNLNGLQAGVFIENSLGPDIVVNGRRIGGGSIAGLNLFSVTEPYVHDSKIFNNGTFPYTTQHCVDIVESHNEMGGGGRSTKHDQFSRLRSYSPTVTGNPLTTATGYSFDSSSVAGGLPGSRHAYIYGIESHGHALAGLYGTGAGSKDIHIFGGRVTGNNIIGSGYDIQFLIGDDEIHLHDVERGTARLAAYTLTDKYKTHPVYTTNATPVTIWTLDSESAFDGVIIVKARVTGIRTGGVSGSAGDCYTCEKIGKFKVAAGIPTLTTTTIVHENEDAGGTNFGFTAGGASAGGEVTGIASNNISWVADIEVQMIGA